MLVAGMVAVLLCSNLIGPAKVSVIDLPWIGALSFGAGNLFFPISYIFGDVLTEVYGYARARRAIWAGFGAMIFATVMSYVVIHMPASSAEPFNKTLQPALETVFGGTARIAVASMIGYWIGDFVNAFVMARMKLLTAGWHLWTRTIGSTVVGQGVGQRNLLSDRLQRYLGEHDNRQGDRLQLGDESAGRGVADAGHLCGGWVPQAR